MQSQVELLLACSVQLFTFRSFRRVCYLRRVIAKVLHLCIKRAFDVGLGGADMDETRLALLLGLLFTQCRLFLVSSDLLVNY